MNTLQEDHADLQDKYDSLSHSTTQKLAAQAAELTARERQVESLSAELHSTQEAAATHSAEVLHLQSALDAQTTTQTDLARHQAEEASWSVLRTELTRQAEHSRQLETAHSRAMVELNTLRERHTSMEVLREENRALERRAAAADELRETVVRLEAELDAARAEREAWCVPLLSQTSISNFFRARNAVPDTPAATPVSITQSLSVLRLEHAHLLEEHGADRAALRRCEAELAAAQTREVDARATADSLLHAARAAEDRVTRAERAVALSEREVGFLQALNVRSYRRCLSLLIAFIFLATNRRATQAKKLLKTRVT